MSWRLASPCRVSPATNSRATWRLNSMLCVRCLAMGFHPSKARLDGQFLLVQPSGPRGPLHQGVIFPRRITMVVMDEAGIGKDAAHRGHDKIGATAYANLDKKGTQQKIRISRKARI